MTPKGDALGATICTAIDQAAAKLNLSSGSASSSSPVGKQEIAVCEPDQNVAISTLKGFFSMTGISIALVGESHAYKDPVPEEPKLPKGQGGMALALRDGDTDGWTPQMFTQAQQEQVKLGGILQEIQDYPTKLKAYRKSQQDCARAKTLMREFPGVDLFVLERAMKEYSSFATTKIARKEDDLLGDWSIRQRSTLIAAYIFLCAAGGPSGHVLVIFGEEHKDIFDFFEYFATASKAITNVARVQRNYCLIKSHVN